MPVVQQLSWLCTFQKIKICIYLYDTLQCSFIWIVGVPPKCVVNQSLPILDSSQDWLQARSSPLDSSSSSFSSLASSACESHEPCWQVSLILYVYNTSCLFQCPLGHLKWFLLGQLFCFLICIFSLVYDPIRSGIRHATNSTVQ